MDVIEELNKIAHATHGSIFIIFDDNDTGLFLSEQAGKLALPHTFVAPTNVFDINFQCQQIYMFDQIDSDVFLMHPPRQPNPNPVTDVILMNITNEYRPDVVSNLAIPYFGIGSSTELHLITMAVHRPDKELYRSLLLKKPKRRPILYHGMNLQGILDDNMVSFGIKEFNAEYSPTTGTLFMEFYVKAWREFVSVTTTIQNIDNLRPMIVRGVLLKIIELGLADPDDGLRAVLNKFQKMDEEGKRIHFIPITTHILRSVYNYPVQPSLWKYQASPTSSSEQEQLQLVDEA